jgi:hypothetical protein
VVTAAKKAPAKIPATSVRLFPRADGSVTATWPQHRYRFLLSDGSTLDVVTPRDDSELRSAILAYTKVDRIEGCARLPDPDQETPT